MTNEQSQAPTTPRSPAAVAAEKAAQSQDQPRQAEQPKGQGSLLRHITDLANALEARDWQAALGHLTDALRDVHGGLNDAPAAPMFNAANAGASAGQMAERLRRFAADHGERASREGVGFAVPWAELLPLLKIALDVILSKRT